MYIGGSFQDGHLRVEGHVICNVSESPMYRNPLCTSRNPLCIGIPYVSETSRRTRDMQRLGIPV